MRLFSLIAVAWLFCQAGISQCPYDTNMDGSQTLDDYLAALADYGLTTWDLELGDQLSGDIDQNDTVNVRDFLDFIAHFHGGLPCSPNEDVDISDHIVGLVLEEYVVHEEPVYSLIDTLSAGAVTYRLYLELDTAGLMVSALYGDAQAPLTISAPDEMYFTSTDGVPFFGISASNVYPPFFDIYPTMEYSSWLSIGRLPESYPGGLMAIVHGPQTDPTDEFQSTGVLEINDSIGGGMFLIDYAMTEMYLNENLKILGQFTVVESADLSGTVNVQIKTLDYDGADTYGYAEGLSFGLTDVEVFGCTDSSASNYNPDATYDDGSCLIPGDIDGDGQITVSDVLDFLDAFGCTSDCGPADLNGDGVVNTWDLILLLMGCC